MRETDSKATAIMQCNYIHHFAQNCHLTILLGSANDVEVVLLTIGKYLLDLTQKLRRKALQYKSKITIHTYQLSFAIDDDIFDAVKTGHLDKMTKKNLVCKRTHNL